MISLMWNLNKLNLARVESGSYQGRVGGGDRETLVEGTNFVIRLVSSGDLKGSTVIVAKKTVSYT